MYVVEEQWEKILKVGQSRILEGFELQGKEVLFYFALQQSIPLKVWEQKSNLYNVSFMNTKRVNIKSEWLEVVIQFKNYNNSLVTNDEGLD